MATLESFQTTYEELKHPLVQGSGTNYFASRLPMRNWNTYHTELSRLSSSRFQTTYEELKLVNYIIFCGRIQSFQTTYEELKHVSSISLECFSKLPDYLWGIETTATRVTALKAVFASRLPMRNWNVRLAPSPSAKLLLPDYLWGIETQVVEHGNGGGGVAGFQTTYEELKLSMIRWTRAWRKGFQTTYEELKPVLDRKGDLVYFGFQTTYEELKQDQAGNWSV